MEPAPRHAAGGGGGGGGGSCEVERIIAGIGGDAAQREAAYAALLALAHGDKADDASTDAPGALALAAACVGPLIETIFAADASVVPAAEYRRAAAVVAEVAMLDDPLPIVAEYLRNERFATAWISTGNAYGAVFQKEPAQLTRDDVLTVAADTVLQTVHWTRGYDAGLVAAGIATMDHIGPWSQFDKLHPGNASDAVLERLLMLALDVAREPHGISEMVQAGIWQVLGWSISGRRAALAMTMIEAGLLEVMVATLNENPPVEWLTWRTPTGMRAGGIFTFGWVLSTLNLPVNKIQLLLEKGFIGVCIQALKTFEMQGASRVETTNVLAVEEPLNLMAMLDLTAPEAEPIVQQLEASTLQFIIQNDISHIKDMGYTTACMCAQVTALSFGKQEGGHGEFRFTQEMIENVLSERLTVFSGGAARFNPVLPPILIRCVVQLCISDANKTLLLQSAEPIKLITEALLLDPQHIRNHGALDQSEDTKGAIQRDAAECFMQLSLFEPGRKMLQNDAAAVDSLRTLKDKALTKEARRFAEGALMALLPEESAASRAVDTRAQHVMMSYQWDAQSTIKRIVAQLQCRGYAVWLDVICMKGSIVDAMSEAIEGAAVMLYGVSEKYKESANCRMEANYAHQQGLDMIPLMVENGYRAKGWLGLILGTRMYYSFYPGKVETDAAFTKEMDALTREIGERGKIKLGTSPLAEGVSPALALPPAPPHDASAATSSRANLAPAGHSVSSSMPTSAGSVEHALTSVGIAELVTFMREQQARDDKNRAKMDAKMEAMRAEMERHREELASSPPQEVVSAARLAALQARVEQLKAGKLLSDEDVLAVEDVIGDFIELQASVPTITTEMVHMHRAVGMVLKLALLSEQLVADGSLARQMQRKLIRAGLRTPN